MSGWKKLLREPNKFNLRFERDGEGRLCAKVDYELTDSVGKNATKVSCVLLAPDFSKVDTLEDLGTTVGVAYQDQLLHTFAPGSEQPGTYYAVLCAEDGHGTDQPIANENPRYYREREVNNTMLAVVDGEDAAAAAGSRAWFEVYRDELLTQKATGAIGRHAWPVLYVRVAPGERVAPGATTLTVTLQDLWSGYPEGFDTVDYLDINLASADGWEVWQGGWVAAPVSPAQADNRNGETALVYRHVAWEPWDTTAAPTGNNGPHRLSGSAGIQFEAYTEGQGWGEPCSAGPGPKTVEVANLVVTKVRSNGPDPSFLLFDPDSSDPELAEPEIGFTIADRGDPHVYLVRIYVRQTSTPPGTGDYVTVRDEQGAVRQFAPGASTMRWDGRVDGGATGERGPYFFEVQAVEFEGQVPQDGSLSGAIDTETFKYEYFTRFAAHDARVAYGEDSSWLEADYQLSDDHGRAPAEVRLYAVGPDLVVRADEPAAPRPTALDVPHAGQVVHEFEEADPAGVYWVVFGGIDDNAPWRREHSARVMLAVNKGQMNRWPAHGYDQLGHGVDEAVMPNIRDFYKVTAAGVRSPGYVLGHRNGPEGALHPGALPMDRVMYHRSHGLLCGGAVLCGNDEDGRQHWIKSNRAGRSNDGAYVSDWSLINTRLVIWDACYSGDTNTCPENGSEGNLAQRTHLQGVQAVLGFHGETGGTALPAKIFFGRLFWWLRHGLSVQEAYDESLDDLESWIQNTNQDMIYGLDPSRFCWYAASDCLGEEENVRTSYRWGYDQGVMFGSPVHTKINPPE